MFQKGFRQAFYFAPLLIFIVGSFHCLLQISMSRCSEQSQSVPHSFEKGAGALFVPLTCFMFFFENIVHVSVMDYPLKHILRGRPFSGERMHVVGSRVQHEHLANAALFVLNLQLRDNFFFSGGVDVSEMEMYNTPPVSWPC